VETVERLARECQEASGVHEKHAFKLGCAVRLEWRLEELFQQRMRAAQQSRQETPTRNTNLPTLADVYQAHEFANRNLYLKLHRRMPRSGSTLGTTRASAYALGHSAGGGIGLDAQVGRRSSTLVLPSRTRG
jgi:hypothetical protein